MILEPTFPVPHWYTVDDVGLPPAAVSTIVASLQHDETPDILVGAVAGLKTIVW